MFCKKLTATLLLTLFLLNLTGVYIAYWIAGVGADQEVKQLLDKQLYDDEDLVKLSVPLHLPYQNSVSSYERVDGEIFFEGKIFKFVKRKIENGNLIFLCLPDYKKTRLHKLKDGVTNDANNIAASPGSKKESGSKANSVKSLQCEFLASQFVLDTSVGYNIIIRSAIPAAAMLSFQPAKTAEHPPELSYT